MTFGQVQEWSPLSDEAINAISSVASLQVFEYDIIRIPRGPLDAMHAMKTHLSCFPLIVGQTYTRYLSVFENFELFLRACPDRFMNHRDIGLENKPINCSNILIRSPSKPFYQSHVNSIIRSIISKENMSEISYV